MLSFQFDDIDDVISHLPEEYEEVIQEEESMNIQNDTSIDYITEDMCFNGMDMQGIQWSKEAISRDQYREQRNKGFKPYLSCKEGENDFRVEQQIKDQKVDRVADNEEFYAFTSSKLREPCTIGHFQLRHLVSVTNKNNVYYLDQNIIKQWLPQHQSSQTVMDLSYMKVTSMRSAYGMLIAGGFDGECIWKHLEDRDLPIKYSRKQLGIINHVDIIKPNRTGVVSALICSNNGQINTINFETSNTEKLLQLPFAVNCSSLHDDLLCAVGDSTETRLVDIRTGQMVASINEHHDYSFACSWHPNGMEFATGNQDKTTRVYDIRNTSKSLHVLGSKIGSICSLNYSHDGNYLIAAEAIDFVHLYETEYYESSQVIDLFGDIAGIGISPDDQSLYIANTDENIGGIFEFQRIQQDPVYYF